MANQKQQQLLRSNIREWNTWRDNHPKENVDLIGANLIGANLSGADLREANLNGQDLRGADLRGADLRGADLRGADLRGANLNGQDFSRANLRGANLREANLRGANLRGANLNGQDLREANLSGANLSRANLSLADLSRANLSRANLSRANLSRANLNGQDLSGANLSGANLSGANLSRANLSGQDLSNKDLREANLSGANLSKTLLLGTNFTGAILTDCNIYGIAAWNVQLKKATQQNLVITQDHEATITIDNLKVAQFIYLMLNNEEIRDVINTLTTKSVLILGRFTPDRKAILNALRDTLRGYNYLPILFDFEKPNSRNFTETARTLAHLSRFIIADLSEPRSIPQELQAIIPLLRVPVKPLLSSRERTYSMFEDFDERDYHWVLPVYQYTDLPHLLATLKEQVIDPAENKARELEK